MELSTSTTLGASLLPALLQCFGIIIIGYFIGRLRILGPYGARGLSIFVQYISLPALVFTTISTISFSNVKWDFVASIFVAKASIFVGVALMTMLLTTPVDLGKSGIYAIAATQSNDFALGYPLLVSLYANSHPEYPAYIYIVAPIQLLILNTAGFFLLETDKLKRENGQRQHLLHSLKGTFTNPIVIMTMLGLIWNVTYGQKDVPLFWELLNTLSSAFSATALFLLGHTIAGKSGSLDKHFSLTSALLVVTKILILPLIIQKFSTVMVQDSKDVQNLSSFSFLYGTIPTAPTTFVFATQYDVPVDVITTTVIFSTLFSAPLMFASATMISLSQYGFENIKFYLSQAISFVSCINFLCCIWLLFVFLIGKRWRSISFGATIYLVYAQLLYSIGGILLFFTNDNLTIFYTQYIITTGGLYATRMFTVFLASLVFVMKWRSLCFILQTRNRINIVGFLVCFLLSYIIAGSLLVSNWNSNCGPNFQLGYIQIITTFALTVLCLICTSLCLILQHICAVKRLNGNPSNLIEEQNAVNGNSSRSKCDSNPIQPSKSVIDTTTQSSVNAQITIDVEDLGFSCCDNRDEEKESLLASPSYNMMCDSQYQCNTERRRHCATLISRYNRALPTSATGLGDNDLIFRHIIFLLLLCAAMILSTAVCFWKLVMEPTTGIFVELEFLDIILNYSQGIMCFMIFGLNKELLDPIRRQWRRLRYGNNRLILPDLEDLPSQTIDICKQFIDHHYEKCTREIGQTITINGVAHNNAFTGSDLVDWLLEIGLAHKRNKAENYGMHLLHGRIIQHFDQCEEFCDNMNVYIFVDENIANL